ncbi:hypothetical protein AC579_5274 [Pseudocercospora musae]|uniref:Uncharacterized protein n=1 Tax=Pseudocercospora musae TaxID=113226 RepID=A0A139IPQ2_9PEZI|nr:hypothetical protein AC579_5274 [Pseudocercospora musae]
MAVEGGAISPSQTELSVPTQLPPRSYTNANKTATKQDLSSAGAGARIQWAVPSPGHPQGIPQYQISQLQYQSQPYSAPGSNSPQYGQQPAGINRGYSGMQTTGKPPQRRETKWRTTITGTIRAFRGRKRRASVIVITYHGAGAYQTSLITQSALAASGSCNMWDATIYGSSELLSCRSWLYLELFSSNDALQL